MTTAKFDEEYQPRLVWDSGRRPHDFKQTGLSPALAELSRLLLLCRFGRAPAPVTPHLPQLFAAGFGLPCSGFARRYYRHRCCFLVLPLLKCFSLERSHL